ncbi:hypothetical protein [Allorhizocola rhizosphaerae]|uniref:hypothetical protein n=1 Tax=Allorhizocola rhizosphaerae TaxID=1872709 RepID=UPI000E3DABBD|nr:hypothetical protein [Allorhizocola rhizosphaerae]
MTIMVRLFVEHEFGVDAVTAQTHRPAHLVGSFPAADARAAMRQFLDAVGDRLPVLPDGETGERHHWIVHIVEGMRRHPDLEVKRDGGWSDYDDVPVFKVRGGHTLTGDSLDFGHVAAFQASYPIYRELRGAAQTGFQVGVPGDFDMALFVLGPVGALRNRRPFTDATIAEVLAIHAEAGSDVLFQIEIPAELVMVARMPPPLRPLVARRLGRVVANLAQQAPEGARFGVHLCLGDMNHRALGRMSDTAPLVALTNAIVKAWPAGRPLEYVHAPFAAAEKPPPTDPGWYEPLRQMRLPDGTRFVAGMAHEDQELAVQQRIVQMIDELTGRRVGVSTSCGLGRRTPEAAARALERISELTGQKSVS